MKIVNRQFEPKILVDYDVYNRQGKGRARVSAISAEGDEGNEDYTEGYDNGSDNEDDNELWHADALCNFVNAQVASDHHDSDSQPPPPGTDDDSTPNAQVNHVADVQSGDTIKQAIDKALGKSTMRLFMLAIINFVEEKKRIQGAVMLDTGAMISIENDLTCFVGYLEPTQVKIGMASSGSFLKNCGVGIRERKFRDSVGNVYVLRDRAFYCPDAAYPILSSGELEKRNMSIVLNPGRIITRESTGLPLPPDGNRAVIIDADNRVLVLEQLEDVPALHWLIPIQATTVAEVEANTFLRTNQEFAARASMLETLAVAADAPSVDDYASTVQSLQQQLEELHLRHSVLYGAANEDTKMLIASAHQALSSIDMQCRMSDTYVDPNRVFASFEASGTRELCARCRHADCNGADSCTRACFVCLAPVGHEASCDQRNLSSLKVHSLCATEESEGANLEGHDPSAPFIAHMALDPSTSTSVDMQVAELSRACSQLQVVQDLTTMAMKHDPNLDPCVAVQQVICSLAAKEQEGGDRHTPLRECTLPATRRDDSLSAMISRDDSLSSTSKPDDSLSAIHARQDDMLSAASWKDDTLSAMHTSMSNEGPSTSHSHESANADTAHLAHALRTVMVAYGWRAVERHSDMIPSVADFAPDEWIELLSPGEKAAVAAAFVEFSAASDAVNDIDKSKPMGEQQVAMISTYIEASRKVESVVDRATKHIASILARTFPFDPGGHIACNIPYLQCCNLSAHTHNVARRRIKGKKVVDICSGQQSLAQFILLSDPTAEVLSFDIISYKQALRDLPEHLHHRIHYVHFDVAKLTFYTLQDFVRKYLCCEVRDLYHIHFSPCCKSYSTADGGLSGYRLADGSPNPTPRNSDGSVNLARYEYAKQWDDIVATVLKTIDMAWGCNPEMLVTIENPVGAFQWHPFVQALLKNGRGWNGGWRLLEVDYCKVASPTWDGDKVYTKKPTHIITAGVRPSFAPPRCNEDCRFRFPDNSGKSRFHLRSIRLDHKSVSGQVKQFGSLRHSIPCSLFALWYEEHEQWIVSRRCADVMQPVNYTSISALSHGKGKGSILGPIRDSSASSSHGKASLVSDSPLDNSTTVSSRKPSIVAESHPQADGNLTRGQRLYLLLHYRFGHASLRRLQSLFPYLSVLTKKNRVECPVCLAAKATYKPHVGRLLRMAYAMGLVYFDIQGPFRIADVDGNLYSLVLLDDYTDFKWQYRLRSRDQLGATLRLWIAHVGLCPERLRHDGASENLGNNGMNAVAQLCLERCIYPERTTPYQSQQMSRVERVHRVFLEAARCMLITTPECTTDLWGYAFMHACFLDQFLGTHAGSCPYARWHGSQPSAELLNSLRTFGSIIYFAHHDDRHKLQMPGHRGIFLGYSPITDACYVRDIDHKHKPVRITRDILARSFHETKHLIREPIQVTHDEYKLLETEPEPISLKDLPEASDLPWEQVLFDNIAPVEKDLQQYYRAFQAFAKDRRLLLSKNPDLSPSHIESEIKKDWRKHVFDSAKRRISDRQADQVTQGAASALGQSLTSGNTASTEDSGGSSSSTMPTENSGGTTASGGKRKHPDSSDSKLDSNKTAKYKQGGTSESDKVGTKRKAVDDDIADIPCEACGGIDPELGNAVLICDGCNKGYHQRCYKISVLPNSADDWLCHACLQPGMRVSIYWKKDKKWHDGTIRAQLSDSMGTEVAYDDGARALENLNSLKWRPLYEHNLAQVASLALECEPDDFRNIGIWMSTTPRSLAHLKKFPPRVQQRWLESRLKEFKSIIGKQAAQIVDKSELPYNALVVPSQWVFKIKADGSFKSRLVVLGHLLPKDGELDLASPTPRLSTLRLLLSIAMQMGLDVHIVDIDTAFTYAQPATTIYCSLPGGLYEDGRLDGKLLLLLRNLYGTDSAPLMFHNLLHNWFVADGFSVNPHDPCLYFKWVEGVPLFALVHVDDVTIVSTTELIADFKKRIQEVFNVKDLGALGANSDGTPSLLLGMEILRTDSEFQLRQTSLIDKLIEKCGNELSSIPHEKVPIRDIRLTSSSSPTTPTEKARWKAKPYRSILGVCGYIMLSTRNECSFAYSQLARFNETYGQDHWAALLALVSYLKKTRDTHYLCISKYGGMSLSSYCDSDWNGTDSAYPTCGWIVFFGHTPFSWAARLQRVTARSTGEAEFIALSSVSQECLYAQMLVSSLRIPVAVLEIFCNDKSRYEDEGSAPKDRYKTAVSIWSDSAVALSQAKKPDCWIVDKLRHIKTAYFFFKSYVRAGNLKLCKVSGTDNPSDIFTKGFGAPGKTAANQRAEVFQRHTLFCSGRRIYQSAEKLSGKP